MDMLIRKARTMDKLTEQLYDYSRLSTDDYEPPLETIDAGRILRETFLENCLLFEDAGLRVDADFAREGADLRPIYAWEIKTPWNGFLQTCFRTPRGTPIILSVCPSAGTAAASCSSLKMTQKSCPKRISHTSLRAFIWEIPPGAGAAAAWA